MPRKTGSRLARAEKTASAVSQAAPELTRRQLEYWVEYGWVVPDGDRAQGRPREFSGRELKILGLMYRLTVAGFPARNAAWIAREAVMKAERAPLGSVLQVSVDLVPGITISFRDL